MSLAVANQQSRLLQIIQRPRPFTPSPSSSTGESGLVTGGTVVTTEGGLGTYVSLSTSGETIDLTAKGVANATGGSGTLTGISAANWLAGGNGSDSFNACTGDDVLLIDAADLQAIIHTGAGFDIAQMVGSQAGAVIALNLTQVKLEVVEAGPGDHIIRGQRDRDMLLGGAGDDLIEGGDEDDRLTVGVG
jgi:Ca2+-binding RTX toxin-like protein